MNLDHQYSHAFFKLAKQHWLGRHVAIFAADNLLWLMLGTLVGIASWNPTIQSFSTFSDSFVFILLLLPAWGVTMFVSKIVKRKRPYLELETKPLIDPIVHTASFPSAHATIAFSIAAMASAVFGIFWYMIAAAALVALGRVASGVHFFSDIIAGALIGFFVTQASMIAFELLLLMLK